MAMFRTASGRSNMEVAACHGTWPKVPCAVLFLPPRVCSEGPRPYVPAVESTLAAACPERICDGSGLQQRHPCPVIFSRQKVCTAPSSLHSGQQPAPHHAQHLCETSPRHSQQQRAQHRAHHLCSSHNNSLHTASAAPYTLPILNLVTAL